MSHQPSQWNTWGQPPQPQQQWGWSYQQPQQPQQPQPPPPPPPPPPQYQQPAQTWGQCFQQPPQQQPSQPQPPPPPQQQPAWAEPTYTWATNHKNNPSPNPTSQSATATTTTTTTTTTTGGWTQPPPRLGRHEGVVCDGCGAVDIEGIRHKCHLCYNYNLCDQCYRAQRETKHHKAAHPMEDITPGGKPGRAQPQRDSPVGKYIRRGRDWKWGDQGHDTQGTCVGLKDQWVSVRWDDGTRNNYRWGSGGAYDVFIVGPAEAKDLVGCRVRRGPDWKWGDQDGNADGFIEAQPQEGVALVRWRNSGLAFQYRWGIEGAYDLVVIGEKEKDGTATATATSTPGTSTAGAGSSSSGSGSGGDDDDGIEAVELSDEEAVDILWKCTIMLRASLKSSVLKGVPGLAKPSSLADVYNKVYNLEQAIRFNNFTQAWREHKYDYWNKQMRSSTATTRHIASCLLEFEVNVLPSAQEDAWKDARKQWCAVLFIIGGRPFNYPTPTGRSSYDPCAGGSGKTSGSSGGGSSDLQNIVSQCKTQ